LFRQHDVLIVVIKINIIFIVKNKDIYNQNGINSQ